VNLDISSGDSRITVDRKASNGVYVAPSENMICRVELGHVLLLSGDSYLEMTTPVAVKVGMALCRNGGEAMSQGDWVVFTVNSTEFTLLPEVAIRLGGVILKKSDKADDWQRELS